MAGMSSDRKFICTITWWSVAAILGLTVALLAVALLAVGLLGLWVLIGALAGLGTTAVSGWLCQTMFCTDFDAVLAKGDSDSASDTDT